MKAIKTDRAPTVIGPYSQAVIAGDYVFVSGQLAIDPRTKKLVEGGIKAQTEQVINNIESILSEAKLSLGNVVKAEVFLSNMNDFSDMNDLYKQRFVSDPKPARYAVEVAKLPGPKGALLEMSVIAYRGDKNE